jgi:hypothetical protein
MAACGGLPGTSTVSDGRRLDEPINDAIRIAPRAPVAGATPAQIAEGFIRAGEDTDETHATAKVYLAHSSVDLWRWSTEETVIYNRSSDLRVKQTGPDSIMVSVAPVGVLSTNGRYRDVAPGTVVSATFGLTMVAGEWRLELPREGFGLWLEGSAFDRLYVAAPVHYVTPGGRELVPDTRWFLNSPRLTTSLARAQLEPVPAHLAKAVSTGVPPGTRLAVSSVPVASGHAQVDLNGAALQADAEDRRAMWAQLSATLSRAAVSSISISVEGTDLELPGVGTVLSSPQGVGYGFSPSPVADSALVRDEDDFKRIDPSYIPDNANARARRLVSPRPDDPSRIPRTWVRLTLSHDGTQIAAVGGDLRELSVWPANENVVRVKRFGTALTRPAYDRSQHLWVAGLDGAGEARIWILATSSVVPPPQPELVSVPWLADRQVVALTISADGTRALVVTQDSKGSDDRLHVAGVLRSANGRPTGLAEPLRLAQALTTIKDVVWLGSESFAVLGRLNDREEVGAWTGHIGEGLDGLRVTLRQPDPTRERLEPRATALTITTAGGSRGLLLVTVDGKILAKVGLSWREITEGTDLLVQGR